MLATITVEYFRSSSSHTPFPPFLTCGVRLDELSGKPEAGYRPEVPSPILDTSDVVRRITLLKKRLLILTG